MKLFAFAAAAAAASCCAGGDYPYRPAGIADVVATGGFWLPRIETNRTVTVKTDFAKCEETGRIANFQRAAKRARGGFKGMAWDDSDVYKVIEGASYTLAQHPDPELDRYLDGLVAVIAAAQEPDGYLYTARTLGHRHHMMGPGKFRTNKSSCELYNAGHLYEAAVAHWEATGKRTLLDVAVKHADLVARTFGLGKGQCREVPGHEEIEIGLCRLYRATGDAKYLALAKHFTAMRGRKDLRPTWGAAYQDHAPLQEQKEALGHAVRASYFYAGAADVAALAGDASCAAAVDRLWENVVEKKLHLNGGIGARKRVTYRDKALGSSYEAFGDAYDLPNQDAYLETCAAIGNALWNERMFLLHGDAKYVDVLERTLYNGLISGVSLGGDEFFYPNPMASKGGYARSKWFDCSCCPVNVARFIPQIPSLAYATRAGADEAYVNLFMASDATLMLKSGKIRISQKTDYPWSGEVLLDIDPGEDGKRFALNVRVPGWCAGRPVPGGLYVQTAPPASGFKAKVDGKEFAFTPVKGYCRIEREWKKGDRVEISMPLETRRIKAHDAVTEDRGRLAVERGPVLYCAEGADNGGSVLDKAIAPDAPFALGECEIAGNRYPALSAPAVQAVRGADGKVSRVPCTMKLVPYFAWCHRGAGEMQTWFPVEPADSIAKPSPRAGGKR